jgi:hypothetical protein
VAKSSRSRGAKKSTAKRSGRPARKAAKKTTRGKARAKAGAYTVPDENVIELRPIRVALQSHVSRLGTAVGSRREAQPELEEALKRLSRWLDDIQEICGPDMAIPL